MKILGITLLAIGFLWIAQDCVNGFGNYQHQKWIHASQNLPSGKTISQPDAIEAMRSVSLDLTNRHRMVLLPAGFMLLGGLLLFRLDSTALRERRHKQPEDGKGTPASLRASP